MHRYLHTLVILLPPFCMEHLHNIFYKAVGYGRNFHGSTYTLLWNYNCHERLAFQSVGVLAVDWPQRYWPLKTYFFSFPSPPPTFFLFPPLLWSFLREGVLGSKNLFSEVDRSTQKPTGSHLSRHHRPFWGPLAAILEFAGFAALQAGRECPVRN